MRQLSITRTNITAGNFIPPYVARFSHDGTAAGSAWPGHGNSRVGR